MARYLTPRRIGVLCVVSLHLDSHAADGSRLGILNFLASHVHLPTAHEIRMAEDTLSSLTEAIADVFESLKTLQSDVPGRSVYDAFLGYLYDLDGLDPLHDFFETLYGRLHPQTPTVGEAALPALSPCSPLGQYIRRCHVEFTRMQFADLQALWNAFVKYRASTWDYWAQKNPDRANKLVEEGINNSSPHASVSLADGDHSQSPMNVSVEDTDSLLTISITQLQKLGTRVSPSLKSSLQEWITNQNNDSGGQSLQHFLTFFEHWKSGQYTMALESLHRYFDYSLVAKSGNADNNMRVYYQYALLHLSVLHADFECWDESIEAMEECIATARENQDTACLNFALSWLLYLRQATPRHKANAFRSISGLTGSGNSEYEEIAFLKARARETKHWSLLSTTLLEEAKLEMYKSGSANKSAEHIIQSSFLNVQYNLKSLMPATHLFQAGFYSRLGQEHIANQATVGMTMASPYICPASDLTRAMCRAALQLAQEGHYDSSLQTLQTPVAPYKGVLKLEQRMVGFTDLIRLMRSLHHDDLYAANYFHIQLQPLRDSSEPELDFELQLLEIDLFIRRQEFERALRTVNKHLARLKASASADIAQRLQFLVLKAKIFAASGSPTKGFSIVLRAASMAERLRLVPIMLEAVAVLATILNDISEFRAARDLVEAVLPAATEQRPLSLSAGLHSTITESYVGIAGLHCKDDPAEGSRNLRTAETHAEQSRSRYARLEDLNGTLDCLSMKARLARLRDDETSASRLDDEYLQILSDRVDSSKQT